MRLAGKSGLVTGASQGIGRGCALEMAREGADVAINYRSNTQEAQAVAEEIRAMGRKAIVLEGDVSDRIRVEEMIAETAAAFGRLDLFVSNAVYSDREEMLKADLDGFRKTIDVAMWGAFYGLRAASLKMVEQGGGGSIVIVSSPHAFIPFAGAMAYNMAKAALDQMARTAALELAPSGIRVNIMHPGWIDTPGERKFFSDEELKKAGEGLPLKRLGRPADIGRGVAFMLSEDAAYMTGSTLLIDGGICLPYWAGVRGDQDKQSGK